MSKSKFAELWTTPHLHQENKLRPPYFTEKELSQLTDVEVSFYRQTDIDQDLPPLKGWEPKTGWHLFDKGTLINILFLRGCDEIEVRRPDRYDVSDGDYKSDEIIWCNARNIDILKHLQAMPTEKLIDYIEQWAQEDYPCWGDDGLALMFLRSGIICQENWKFLSDVDRIEMVKFHGIDPKTPFLESVLLILQSQLDIIMRVKRVAPHLFESQRSSEDRSEDEGWPEDEEIIGGEEERKEVGSAPSSYKPLQKGEKNVDGDDKAMSDFYPGIKGLGPNDVEDENCGRCIFAELQVDIQLVRAEMETGGLPEKIHEYSVRRPLIDLVAVEHLQHYRSLMSAKALDNEHLCPDVMTIVREYFVDYPDEKDWHYQNDTGIFPPRENKEKSEVDEEIQDEDESEVDEEIQDEDESEVDEEIQAGVQDLSTSALT